MRELTQIKLKFKSQNSKFKIQSVLTDRIIPVAVIPELNSGQVLTNPPAGGQDYSLSRHSDESQDRL